MRHRFLCPDCVYRCDCLAVHRPCVGTTFDHHRYLLGEDPPLERRAASEDGRTNEQQMIDGDRRPYEPPTITDLDPDDSPLWQRYLAGDR